jgi:EAL domain-containing protein (putative c-di-GMP-specific phosphodiesterase class I)
VKKTLLERVIEPGAISAVFQPIVDIRVSPVALVAVEGLSRGPRDSTLEAPDILFEFARRKHEESIVDRAALVAILDSARDLPRELDLHLNVHASTIGRDSGFVDFLEKVCRANGIAIERLTLEILEHSNFVEEDRYLAAVDGLRRAGVGIALDDVGVGVSNFRMILLTRPATLKVDRCLVRGIGDDPYRQATLRALRLLADQVGAAIVAEGVETEGDLATLRSLAVELAQGYLFSRPLDVAGLNALLDSAPFGSCVRQPLIAAAS